MNFRQRLKYYKGLTLSKVVAGVQKVVKSNSQTVIDLNLFQLQVGRDAKGKEIKPKYSPATVKRKKAKGDPYDKVTLYDTGKFYQGFFLQGVEFPFHIFSKDSKAPLLAKRYGPIFGLDRESQRALNSVYLKADIQAYYRKLLLL